MILHVLTICLFAYGSTLADDTLDRLARVESVLTDVLNRNAKLDHRLAALEQENVVIKQANLVLEERVRQLEEKETDAEGDEIGKTVDGKSRADDGNENRGETEMITPKSSKRFVSDFQGSAVAFTAVVNKPRLSNLGSGQTIIYEFTVTNVGGAYHNTTGVFTAPTGGVYVFNYAVMVDPGLAEYIELVKNGGHVMWNYGHAPGASHLISASRTATLELKVGDEVWIRTSTASTHGDGIIHGNGYTTFSGWLITLYE